uniref:Putative esophageal gland cell secretory protein 38 n=1 Tax=Meloidogyne incognita TaxID=6306 RepID=Q5QJ71_MELIC|nr:putative esophageal gland cell secretory protein 38 [Meloidogyne incognita]
MTCSINIFIILFITLIIGICTEAKIRKQFVDSPQEPQAKSVDLNLQVLIFIKRCKSQLWAVGLNNYKTQFPNCSLIEEIYSRHYPFGMLKTTQWLLQTLLLFSAMYFPYFEVHDISLVVFFTLQFSVLFTGFYIIAQFMKVKIIQNQLICLLSSFLI